MTLTAILDEHWFFSSWNGDLTGDENPQNITMKVNKTVTAHFTFTRDETIPPIVEILTPKNNRMHIFNKLIFTLNILPIPVIVQMLTIEVNTSENESGMDRVEFFVDGVLKDMDTTAPYSCDWREIISGKHTITVKAYDNAENSAPPQPHRV